MDGIQNEKQPDPSSDLWDLVLHMHWQRALEHVQSNPQDARFMDGHWHETPLFLACQHEPPIDVLEAIIEANPGSVLVVSRENRDLPLHIACRYQADAVIIEALLEHEPKTVSVPTKWGLTPMMVLWNFRPKEYFDDRCQPVEYRNYETIEYDNEGYWIKVLAILKATAHNIKNDFASKDSNSDNAVVESSPVPATAVKYDDSTFFVHAAVSMGVHNCPMLFLWYVIDRYPKQVFQRDKRGLLPLHVAIQRVSWSKNKKRRFPPKQQPFIECLLEAYPGGAKERIFGDHDRYPLHSAIANGHAWSQGVRDIFLAAPEVLGMPDSSTGLFPFELASIPIAKQENTGDVGILDTVYQLLRAKPDVIHYRLLEVAKAKENPRPIDDSVQATYEESRKRMLLVVFAEIFLGAFLLATCHESVLGLVQSAT